MSPLKLIAPMVLLGLVSSVHAEPACNAGCQKTLAALPVAKAVPTPKSAPMVKDAAWYKRQAEAAAQIRRNNVVINSNGGGWWDDKSDTPRSMLAVVQIRPVLDSYLSDYATTRFRHVTTAAYNAHGGRWILVCGEINTKNKFGGYIGWQTFGAALKPNDETELWLDDAAFTPAVIRNIC